MKGYVVQDRFDGDWRLVGVSQSMEGAKQLAQEDLEDASGEWENEWYGDQNIVLERDYGDEAYVGWYQIREIEVHP